MPVNLGLTHCSLLTMLTTARFTQPCLLQLPLEQSSQTHPLLIQLLAVQQRPSLCQEPRHVYSKNRFQLLRDHNLMERYDQKLLSKKINRVSCLKNLIPNYILKIWSKIWIRLWSKNLSLIYVLNMFKNVTKILI